MKCKPWILALVLLMQAGATVRAQVWEERAPMPTARAGVAAAVLEGRFYAVGGEDALGRPLAAVERYDPATDQWEALPPLQEARTNAAAVVYDGALYVVGGRGRSGGERERRVLDSVERFDPGTGMWTFVHAMREEREGPAALVRRGQIVVVGGSDDHGMMEPSLEFYDRERDEWREIEGGRLLLGRASFAAATVGDTLYFLGGFGPVSGPIDDIEQFPRRNFSRLPRLAFPRGGLGAVVVGDTIYVIGGLGPDARPLPDVDAYVPGAGSWHSAGRLRQARARFGAAALGDRIFVVGGRVDRTTVLATLETARVSVSVDVEMPDPLLALVLEQNAPNPFTVRTRMRYHLPGGSATQAEIEVFDVQGRLVARLAGRAAALGWHEAEWDGRTLQGSPAPSGLYLCRLRYAGAQRAVTMVLVR